MDHQYNHQWRQGSPQANMCPVCYIPHIPFCPPHPHYPLPIPRFPLPPPDYQRPRFSSQSPLPPMAPHNLPYVGNASDRFGDPRSWHGNQNFLYGPDVDHGYAVDGEADRSYKRPRVDEIAPPESSVISDDERRLKLIWEHGGGASLGGSNNETTNRYLQNNGPSLRMNEFGSDDRKFEQSAFHKHENAHNNRQIHKINSVPAKELHYSNVDNRPPGNFYQYPHHNKDGSYNQFHNRQQHHPRYPQQDGYQGPAGYHVPRPFGNKVDQPPLPVSPPPPIPLEPPGLRSSDFKPGSSLGQPSISWQSASEVQSFNQTYYQNNPPMHGSAEFVTKDAQTFNRTAPRQYGVEGHSFPLTQFPSDKPRVIDASQLFKQPDRATRPDHIVIVLRGLPGSGKSYLAKMVRDLEVENGSDAPRIHAMDDYFMTEVEKVDETDASKASNFIRSRKPVIKTVMEYCYEPEMEEAYRESMLKAFRRTVEEGVFSFVIVDDRNLRVADFAQFWAIGKRSGYEVYILEPMYKDPAGCAARNVHGFTLEDIQDMAGQWEDAPSLYLRLDVKSLFHGDDLKESGILEVDMDMGDEDPNEDLSPQEESKTEKLKVPSTGGEEPRALVSSKDGKRWVGEEEQTADVKELSRSKWSNDIDDDDDVEGSRGRKRNFSTSSGLIQAYSKEGKSVLWGDQIRDTGFSIGAAKLAKTTSLVIGPGAGYNLKSNPLPKEENLSSSNFVSSKKQTVLQERIQAEHESFKAVFDRRKQRIGLDAEED